MTGQDAQPPAHWQTHAAPLVGAPEGYRWALVRVRPRNGWAQLAAAFRAAWHVVDRAQGRP